MLLYQNWQLCKELLVLLLRVEEVLKMIGDVRMEKKIEKRLKGGKKKKSQHRLHLHPLLKSQPHNNINLVLQQKHYGTNKMNFLVV